VRREAEALLEHGFRVDVVCLRAAGEARRELVGGVEVFRLPVAHRRAGLFRYAAEYAAFFTLAALRVAHLHLRRRYAVIQVNTMPDVLVFTALLPRLMGTPVVLDMHEVIPELYAAKFGKPMDSYPVRLLAGAERVSTWFADCVLTVSEPTRRVLEGRGIAPGKLSVVMNAPDERLFQHTATDRVTVANQAVTLISHGTLAERYGFQTAIIAVALLADAQRDVRLLVVGTGDYETTLRNLARELGVEPRVTFTGRRTLEEVAELLPSADIGVVANESNVFTDLVLPTKLMEYVAVGVPVVVARTPAVEEYFDDTMVTFFEAGDAASLADAVLDLSRDAARAQAKVTHARAQFLTNYNWSAMGAEYAGIIARVAASANDPTSAHRTPR
jgi:glycosyltransferase involved in cell wall biosynthesis